MTMTVESLGYEHLKFLIASERRRLEDLDDRIRELHSTEAFRRDCARILNEYETLLAEYQTHGSVANWFYVTPRYDDELPMFTRVQVVEHNAQHHYAEGLTGIVLGYRSHPDMIYPTGWHYIQFRNDTTTYPRRDMMPYVHRDYLEVIE